MQLPNAAFPLKQIVSGLFLFCLTLQASAQPGAPEAAVYTAAEWLPVYPQVSVNGSNSDSLALFMSHNGRLLVQTDTLMALGIRVPSEFLQQARRATGKPPAADGGFAAPAENQTAPDAGQADWLELDSIPQLTLDYQAASQNLALTVPLAWLQRPIAQFGEEENPAYPIARPGFAGVLNYDYNFSRNNHGHTHQGLLAEARLATPVGYLNHSQLWSQQKQQDETASTNVRLDTYWRSTWPEKGLVFSAGDVLTGQLNGFGGSRIGGLKLEHTYRTQPWRNTTPLLAYRGEATLPSTVDLYLNGVKQYSNHVNAGQYEITLPPTISGSGMAQVVATDMLGRTVVMDMPLYGGSGLLAKGLTEWSLEAGYS